MATQPNLSFGSLVLCAPANGRDGYRRTKNNVTAADAIQISVLGTAGRIKMIVGRAQTEQTSKVLEFECQSCFEHLTDLESFIDQAEAAASDTRDNLRDLYFGHLNVGATFNEENMDFEFEAGEIWQGASGFWLNFVARFKKYGA